MLTHYFCDVSQSVYSVDIKSLYFVCSTDGLCGSLRMTKRKPGKQTSVSSPSLTRWKTSGRKYFIGESHLQHLTYIQTEWLTVSILCLSSCFPSLYNHIQLSSNLISGCDYSLFKVRVIFPICNLTPAPFSSIYLSTSITAHVCLFRLWPVSATN